MSKPKNIKTDVWMPLYIGDYLASTTRLTAEQHGAYLLLIMDYWRNGPPPDDDAVLAQICRMSPDAWSNACSIVRAFFKQCDGKLIHTRIDAEMQAAQEKKLTAKEKAEAAAAKRWGKNAPSNATSNATSTPQAMPESCPSPSPSPIKSTTNILAQKPRADYSEDFIHAWSKYPARPGANKQQSFKAWNARIKDGADPRAMIRGVERYAAYVKAMGISPEYIKQPATFFGPDRHYESDWTPTPQGNSYGNAKQSHTASLIAELTGANRQRESAVFVGTAERVD